MAERGARGPRGERGARGRPGARGPVGPRGAAGRDSDDDRFEELIRGHEEALNRLRSEIAKMRGTIERLRVQARDAKQIRLRPRINRSEG